MSQVCHKCRETKAAEEFSRDRSRKSGLQRCCKACNAAYYRANRERQLASRREHYKKHRERRREQERRRYREDKQYREAAIARAAKWQKDNAARHGEFTKRYREENPGLQREYKVRRRSRESVDQEARKEVLAWIEQILGTPCVYCGDPGEVIDHVTALARGGKHSPHNLVSACNHCNATKSDRLLSAFLADHPAWQTVSRVVT